MFAVQFTDKELVPLLCCTKVTSTPCLETAESSLTVLQETTVLIFTPQTLLTLQHLLLTVPTVKHALSKE